LWTASCVLACSFQFGEVFADDVVHAQILDDEASTPISARGNVFDEFIQLVGADQRVMVTKPADARVRLCA